MEWQQEPDGKEAEARWNESRIKLEWKHEQNGMEAEAKGNGNRSKEWKQKLEGVKPGARWNGSRNNKKCHQEPDQCRTLSLSILVLSLLPEGGR